MRHNRFVRRRVVRLNHMAPALYVMWIWEVESTSPDLKDTDLTTPDHKPVGKLIVMPTSKDGVREELTYEEAEKRIGTTPLTIAIENPGTWRGLFAKP